MVYDRAVSDPNFLALGDAEPLVRATTMFVFAHPTRPGRLVKVFNPKRLTEKQRQSMPWYKRDRRHGTFQFLVRSMTEYLAYQCRGNASLGILPTIYELVQTEYGFGMVVERIEDYDHQLSPTLKTVVLREGLTPQLVALVNEICDVMAERHIIVSDFHANNFLVVENPQGTRRLVVIDGLGDRNIVPLSTLSQAWNARRIRERQQHMLDKLAGLKSAS